jgi:GAF domain-containing protein/multidrug resistance efflux pump
MPEESTSKVFQLYRLAYSLIFCRNLQEILQSALATVAKTLQARTAILWQFSSAEGSLVPVQVVLEDKSIKTKNVALGSDYLGEVFRSGKSVFLTPEVLQQPNKHIQLPKELRARTGLCVPFKGKPELEGVLEVINRADGAVAFTDEDAEYVTKALELVGVAATNMRSQEEQSRNQLNAITRLTLLYDISQIFNSTLELTGLLPIITEKIRDILEAHTCTIWLLDEKGEKIVCGKSMGGYEEQFASYEANIADDIAGEVIQQGEGILLEDASEDERLKKRFKNPEEFPVYTYIAAPLECKGEILGTLEVMNRLIEEAYNEEDQFLLNDLSHQAAVSIHNANLLQAERKAKELDLLLTISHEITSTLNLDRVLKTIVNHAATLIPYERAAIALVERNKLELAAVSGKIEIDKSEEMKDLKDILTWASGLGKGLYVSEFNGKIVADREETKEKFKKYFEKGGAKSFVSIPLKDEEGDVGILSFESGAPYFLDERHLEVASILANQATVAVRNALLYKQVPLMGLMHPFMQKKARLMKMPRERRIAWGIGLAVLAALLTFVPWNMNIVGDASVLPGRRIPVVSEVEGIVRNVNFHEGDRVHSGTALASLIDNDYKLALEEQQTRRDVLAKQISGSQSVGDLAGARLQQLHLEQTDREIEFYKYQLSRTNITAPVDGVLITPRIEEKVGYLQKKGEPFCEIADMNKPRAEILVDETDASFLQDGQKVRLKMNAFPTEKFYGYVNLLGAQLVTEGQNRFYRVEAKVDNPRLLLKSGMAGKAKVEVGSHSIGYVILRKPVGFLWKKLWVWL